MFSLLTSTLIFTNILLLGSSRLAFYVQVVALQGLLLGSLTLFLHKGALEPRVVALAISTTVLKGLVFPWLLFRAMREVQVKREVEPLVGYTASLVVGGILFGFSMWLSRKLPIQSGVSSKVILPVAFFTMFTGCFLIASRTKAITQVISYVVIENGIYFFGMSFIGEVPMFIELGILLDITVGVFIMGILIHHINREFDSHDVRRLSALKDSES